MTGRRRRRSGLILALLASGALAPSLARADGQPPVAADAVARQVRQAGEDAQRGAVAEPAGSPSGHDAQTSGPDTGAEAAAAPEDGAAGTDAAAHGTAATETRPPQPYEVIRSLQFLQDEIAQGNAKAIPVQAQLLRYYGPTFLRQPLDVWKDPRNLRALALYALSGGPPDVLRELIAKLQPKGDDELLLDGSLAYVENQVDKAMKKLSALDLTFAEPDLAGQLNLALAQVEQLRAPEDALKRLEQVMLVAPGTLLEEAALRMGVLLAEQNGDHAKADRYARQYFDRYGNSVYAGNFRARFSAVYAERPAGTEQDTMDTVADCVAKLPTSQQITIYLAVGRRALVAGNLTLAGIASNKALAIQDGPKKDRERALLYLAAATLTHRDKSAIQTDLEAINPDDLHPADRKLFAATSDVLNQITKPLMISAALEESVAQEPPPVPDSAVLARGEELLKAVRGDLAKTSQ
ncbi:hypothetical protein [Jiella sp. M17.18]|uniref:hypothetical protein n=1 Tax=Jiella sp. M17.18 TaxID=3234247 RepID=UPI0034DF1FBF